MPDNTIADQVARIAIQRASGGEYPSDRIGRAAVNHWRYTLTQLERVKLVVAAHVELGHAPPAPVWKQS